MLKSTDGSWDARLDQARLPQFARQWVLWEQGAFGSKQVIYGRTPDEYFSFVLDSAELTVEQLANKKVLEIGFGHGRVLAGFQGHGVKAVGLDIVRPPLSANLESGSTVCADLFAMPLCPGQFDLVVCLGVIHHTPDPKAAFAAVSSRVAPGGKLLMYVYEPFVPKLLIMRRFLPFSWLLPEAVRLAMARAYGIVRSLFKKNSKTIRGNYTLGMFDVLSPRNSSEHRPDEVFSWFREKGFSVKRVASCIYLGVAKENAN